MSKKERVIKYSFYIIPVLLWLAFIPLIFTNGIWVDESFSLKLVNHSFKAVTSLTAQDFHPPLYYYILKIGIFIFSPIMQNGEVWIGRFVSYVPLLAQIYLGLSLTKKMFGKRTAFLFCLCTIMMPMLFQHGFDIRMYSWAMFFITGCFLNCVAALKYHQFRYYVGMTIFAVCAAYTHNFALISAFFVYVFFILSCMICRDVKALKGGLLSGVIVLICYLPWLSTALNQISAANHSFWISPITIGTLVDYLYTIVYTGHKWVSRILAALIVILAVMALIHIKKKETLFILGAVSIVICTVLVGFVVSIATQPIFVMRYAVPALGCFWLGVSIAADQFFKEKKWYIVLIAFLLCGSFSVKYAVKTMVNTNKQISHCVSSLNELTASTDVFLFDSDCYHLQLETSYYFQHNPCIKYSSTIYKNSYDRFILTVYSDCKLSASTQLDIIAGNQKYWAFCTASGDLYKSLINKGYSLSSNGKFQFNSIEFELFEVMSK